MLWFVFTLLLISFLLDWYTYMGVKTILSGDKKGNRFFVGIYWVVFAGTNIVLILAFIFIGRGTHSLPAVTQWAINIFLTLFVTKLVFCIVLFTGDITRFIIAVFRFLEGNKYRGKFVPERRKLVSQLGVLAAGIPFLSFIYGMARGKYDYTVHRQVVYFDELPQAFDGFTITQLSDIHAGSFDNEEAVQRGIDLAKAQNGDLFVFTGDLINNVATELAPWASYFSQLKAPFGQFSILGNHDYGEYVNWESQEKKEANFNAVKNQHENLGYRLLMNENIKIKKDGQKIELIGVENWGLGFIKKGDLNRALLGTDGKSFKILLSHDPSHWEEEVKNNPRKIHLTLSGHTHGMQFGVETPNFSWSPVQYRYPHWAGLKTENNRSIYINRGFGFIGFSGRVGIWPEITVIELRRKA